MKELAEILKACADHGGEAMSLATVVQTSGSTYRRPGARMLILPDGSTIGSISGGCLEQDVVEKAADARQGRQTVLLSYDTSAEEDIVFGAGLGCTGIVNILLEPIHADSALPAFLQDLNQRRQTGVVATIFKIEGSVSATLGERLLLQANGEVAGHPATPVVKHKLLEAAREVARHGHATNIQVEVEGGVLEVFIEMIQSPAPLILFGAGYDAIPVVRLAKELGFHVTVVDGRPAYAQAGRFPLADAVITSPPGGELPCPLDERTSAVIMSHNYLIDRAWLKKLLPLDLRYLGLMGPRKRAEKMMHELRQEEGISAADLLSRRLHNPVGLDIGAESPEQIALAILAEIQAACACHAGGMLREKKGPIHAPAFTQ